MTAPVFYLLAGPNGAGKSTLYRSAVAQGLIPAEAEFVNADLHEAAHLQHVVDPAERSRLARQWSDARRAQCLAEGRSFASETVFSHTSKLDLMSAAQRVGFEGPLGASAAAVFAQTRQAGWAEHYDGAVFAHLRGDVPPAKP